MKKKCSKCKKIKTFQNFYRDKQKSDGLTSHCRQCKRKAHLKNFEVSRQKRSANAKRWYSKQKEQVKMANKKRYKAIRSELFELLGDQCKLCGFNDRKILQVDHVKGGGNKERKMHGGWDILYGNMIKKIKVGSQEYRILCANCNILEAIRKGHKKSIWI